MSAMEEVLLFVCGVGAALAEEGAFASAPTVRDEGGTGGSFLLACREWKSWTAFR